MRTWKYRIVFLSYSLFAFYMIYTDEILRFIAPNFVWLTYISWILLTIFLFMIPDKHSLICGCEEYGSKKTGNFKEASKAIFLIYPLILFIALNPSDITSINMPAIKNIDHQTNAITIFDLKNKKTKIDKSLRLPVDEDGYANLNIFAIWTLAVNYPYVIESHKFRTMGMVSEISGDYITIQRLLMTCCAADIQPVEMDVKVKSPHDFQKGGWYAFSGWIFIRDKYLIFVAEETAQIGSPQNHYLSRWDSIPRFKSRDP